MKIVYFMLCVVGTVVPLSQLVPFLSERGVDIPLFIDQAFANRVSAFAWLDVLVSAVVVLSFILWEGNRIKMKRLWVPVAGLLTVGVSLGLPLFLLLREIHLSKDERDILPS